MQGREQKMEYYMGIDISKRYFDICCLPEGQQRRFENNNKGIRQCLKMLIDLRPKLHNYVTQCRSNYS